MRDEFRGGRGGLRGRGGPMRGGPRGGMRGGYGGEQRDRYQPEYPR